MLQGLKVAMAWLMMGAGWWVGHPSAAPLTAHVRHAVHHHPRARDAWVDHYAAMVRFPVGFHNANEHAAAIGLHVLNAVLHGQTMAGDLQGQSGSTLYLRDLVGRDRSEHRVLLSPDAVLWKGGWWFWDRRDVNKDQAVNLVMDHHRVLAVLGFHDAYGRVVKSQGEWVAVEDVRTGRYGNPACAPEVGRPIVAHAIPFTVWSSQRGHLPVGSLVQYTSYGVPGYPQILGGIEDYGSAPCGGSASPG